MKSASLNAKYQGLLRILNKHQKAAVAFSGGVDSTLLLQAAAEVFGADLAVFHVHTPLQKPGITEQAKRTCQRLGCQLTVVDLNPLSWPEFTDNRPSRCYFCKMGLYTHLSSLLVPGGVLLDGTNSDDLKEDRPGLKAIRQLQVQIPLAEAGFAKQEIRAVCRELNLENWDLPSESCLATRIIHGVRIRPKLLSDIQAGEDFLQKKGFVGCRVRLNNDSVFISLSQGDIGHMLGQTSRDEVVNFFKKFNYTKVFLDLSERAAILNND